MIKVKNGPWTTDLTFVWTTSLAFEIKINISFPSVVTERSSFSANSDLINIASSLFIKTSNTPSHPKTRNSSCSLSRSTIETSGIQDTG